MSHMLSDEDSTDSDSGIRFKTENTRKQTSVPTFRTNQQLSTKRNDERSFDSHRSYASHSRHRDRSRDRKYSKDRHRSRSKEDRHKRSTSTDRHKRSTSSDRQRSTSKELRKDSIKTSRYDTEKSRDYSRYSSEKNRQLESSRGRKETESENSKRDRSKIRHSSKTKESSLKIEVKDSYNSVAPKRIRKNSEISFSDDQYTSEKNEPYRPVLSTKINTKDSSSDSDSTYGPKPPSKSKTMSNNLKTLGPVRPKTKSKTDTNLVSKKSEISDKKTFNNLEGSKEEIFGPTLPTRLSKNNSDDSESDNSNIYGPTLPSKSKVNESIDVYGPTLPQNNSSTENTYGPSMPPKNQIKENSDNSSNSFGPTLPPHLQKTIKETQCNKPKIMGPTLPAHLREKLATQTDLKCEPSTTQDSENSDDDMIGPLPEGHSSKNISLLEERALEMRINALNPVDTAPKREEWMTALPAVHRISNLGLGPRQFRAKEGPDLSDRSSWTDTPEDKEKKTSKEEVKVDIKEQSKLEHIAKRDKEQEDMVKKHKKKKKREKALIELHQEKLAKKKKEESSLPKERRPFDRDVDLKVNRFDEAQKKAILKKAQLLDTRFSTGEAKFL